MNVGVMFDNYSVVRYDHIDMFDRTFKEKFGVGTNAFIRHVSRAHGNNDSLTSVPLSVPYFIVCTDSHILHLIDNYIQKYVKVRRNIDLWQSCLEAVGWFDVLYEKKLDNAYMCIFRFDEERMHRNLFLGKLI